MTSETTRVRRETIGAAITDDLFSLTFIDFHSKKRSPKKAFWVIRTMPSGSLSEENNIISFKQMWYHFTPRTQTRFPVLLYDFLWYEQRELLHADTNKDGESGSRPRLGLRLGRRSPFQRIEKEVRHTQLIINFIVWAENPKDSRVCLRQPFPSSLLDSSLPQSHT